jgi:hypothetical protein
VLLSTSKVCAVLQGYERNTNVMKLVENMVERPPWGCVGVCRRAA